MNSPRLVVNSEALGENFVPEEVVGRKDEIGQVMRSLAPAILLRKPLHVWLHGDSGTGKTAVATCTLRELKQKHGINGAYVCCWQHHSLYKVADGLIDQLRILRAEQQDTALKLKKLEKHLDGKPLVLVLDEIDRVAPRERNEIIYGLCNLGQVGLVCISHKRDTFFSLAAGTRSRLCPQFVACAPYPVSDLAGILRDRAVLALEAGCYTESLLQRISRLSHGDARIAVQILRSAAEWAEQERCSRIEARHVARVWNGATEEPNGSVFDSLTQDHRMLYDIVREHHEIDSKTLHQRYLDRCRGMSRMPIAVRTFSKYIGRLIHVGLVNCEPARLKGKVRLLSIRN